MQAVSSKLGGKDIRSASSPEQPARLQQTEQPPPTAAELEAARYRHLCKRQALVLHALAELLDHPTLDRGLVALASELKARFRCTRVAIGLYRGDRLKLRTVSEQSRIDPKAVASTSLVAALLEACEQDSAIHFPGGPKPLQIVQAHRALCAGNGELEVFTVPLAHDGELLGALLLERSSRRPWSSSTIELFEQLAAVFAPVIAASIDRERSVWSRLGELPRRLCAAVFGPRRLALKLGALALAAVLTAAHFTPVTYEVSADGELVSLERRVVTAPVLGYIEEVTVRPGDRVAAGDLLVRLDTRDLELEAEKLSNELQTADSEFRAAMASYDRTEMAIAQARQRRSRAQLDLVEQQLERVRIVAPTAGIVVSGDLTQSLGAPVERGMELLVLAPALGYEVQLLVDERDIGAIRVGQQGRLTLRSSPADGERFTVTAIRPIAESAGGRTRFRVEASLERQIQGLRPGQTGVGKVAVGERSLLWRWTHRFTAWARLELWEIAG
ncbi:MAG: HlyD family efflux transporter periplasmic adaptor subunit [Pseudomonadota bacterium]